MHPLLSRSLNLPFYWRKVRRSSEKRIVLTNVTASKAETDEADDVLKAHVITPDTEFEKKVEYFSRHINWVTFFAIIWSFDENILFLRYRIRKKMTDSFNRKVINRNYLLNIRLYQIIRYKRKRGGAQCPKDSWKSEQSMKLNWNSRNSSESLQVKTAFIVELNLNKSQFALFKKPVYMQYVAVNWVPFLWHIWMSENNILCEFASTV